MFMEEVAKSVGIETEKKFLVSGKKWKTEDYAVIRQGYLNSDMHRTVRVRVSGPKAWITVKGLTVNGSRKEFEYSVPTQDGNELLGLCEEPLLEKRRHIVYYEGHKWEVDEYLGANEGLVVAEIELSTNCEEVPLPDWIHEEITDDPRYFNSRLCKVPYSTWKK